MSEVESGGIYPPTIFLLVVEIILYITFSVIAANAAYHAIEEGVLGSDVIDYYGTTQSELEYRLATPIHAFVTGFSHLQYFLLYLVYATAISIMLGIFYRILIINFRLLMVCSSAILSAMFCGILFADHVINEYYFLAQINPTALKQGAFMPYQVAATLVPILFGLWFVKMAIKQWMSSGKPPVT